MRYDNFSLYRSFTEKKLTVLMAVICVIYMLGNLPQMIIMSVQDESKEGVWKFQVGYIERSSREIMLCFKKPSPKKNISVPILMILKTYPSCF